MLKAQIMYNSSKFTYPFSAYFIRTAIVFCNYYKEYNEAVSTKYGDNNMYEIEIEILQIASSMFEN